METSSVILDRHGDDTDSTPRPGAGCSILRRRRPSRAELVERKHRLEGEINVLPSELRRRRGRGQSTVDVERRLAQAQQQHFQTRLDIDRTGPD